MGLSLIGSRSAFDTLPSGSGFTPPTEVKSLPNPDPYNYSIKHVEEIDTFLIVWVNYPDCTNYEGNKILVYQDVPLVRLINQHCIDPHFSENQKYCSPIARFVPTNGGWEYARQFVLAVKNKSH